MIEETRRKGRIPDMEVVWEFIDTSYYINKIVELEEKLEGDRRKQIRGFLVALSSLVWNLRLTDRQPDSRVGPYRAGARHAGSSRRNGGQFLHSFRSLVGQTFSGVSLVNLRGSHLSDCVTT